MTVQGPVKKQQPDRMLHGGGGGGSEAKKMVCVPKLDLQVRAPLMNFISFRRKIFLIWLGGGGSAKFRGGPISRPTPPPPVSLSKGLPLRA